MLYYAIREAHGNQIPAQIKSELWEREIKIDHDWSKSPKIWWGPFQRASSNFFLKIPSARSAVVRNSAASQRLHSRTSTKFGLSDRTIICMTDDMVLLRKSSHWMILWKSNRLLTCDHFFDPYPIPDWPRRFAAPPLCCSHDVSLRGRHVSIHFLGLSSALW